MSTGMAIEEMKPVNKPAVWARPSRMCKDHMQVTFYSQIYMYIALACTVYVIQLDSVIARSTGYKIHVHVHVAISRPLGQHQIYCTKPLGLRLLDSSAINLI